MSSIRRGFLNNRLSQTASQSAASQAANYDALNQLNVLCCIVVFCAFPYHPAEVVKMFCHILIVSLIHLNTLLSSINSQLHKFHQITIPSLPYQLYIPVCLRCCLYDAPRLVSLSFYASMLKLSH